VGESYHNLQRETTFQGRASRTRAFPSATWERGAGKPDTKILWSDEATQANLSLMKAVITFFLVVILGFGFLQFVTWLLAEPPMHVFYVNSKGVVKMK
jgi:hypothetical protein